MCGMGAAVQAHADPRCRVCRSGTAALVAQSSCPIWGAMFPEQAALSPALMHRTAVASEPMSDNLRMTLQCSRHSGPILHTAATVLVEHRSSIFMASRPAHVLLSCAEQLEGADCPMVGECITCSAIPLVQASWPVSSTPVMSHIKRVSLEAVSAPSTGVAKSLARGTR